LNILSLQAAAVRAVITDQVHQTAHHQPEQVLVDIEQQAVSPLLLARQLQSQSAVVAV
jgi:hypothetical protein